MPRAVNATTRILVPKIWHNRFPAVLHRVNARLRNSFAIPKIRKIGPDGLIIGRKTNQETHLYAVLGIVIKALLSTVAQTIRLQGQA